MDREQISALLNKLDELVPWDKATVLLVQYGGGADESKVKATEAGYLRFGLEFMKGAFLPKADEKSDLIKMNLGSVISEDSTVSFDCFERVGSLQEPSKPILSAKFLSWVLAIVAGFFVVMTIIGIVTTFKWLFY